MNCSNCGREIQIGEAFCRFCGKEIRIVPDYNVLEDDLNALMETTVKNKPQKPDAKITTNEVEVNEQQEPLKKQEKNH